MPLDSGGDGVSAGLAAGSISCPSSQAPKSPPKSPVASPTPMATLHISGEGAAPVPVAREPQPRPQLTPQEAEESAEAALSALLKADDELRSLWGNRAGPTIPDSAYRNLLDQVRDLQPPAIAAAELNLEYQLAQPNNDAKILEAQQMLDRAERATDISGGDGAQPSVASASGSSPGLAPEWAERRARTKLFALLKANDVLRHFWSNAYRASGRPFTDSAYHDLLDKVRALRPSAIAAAELNLKFQLAQPNNDVKILEAKEIRDRAEHTSIISDRRI
jgi:hypothetical protein